MNELRDCIEDSRKKKFQPRSEKACTKNDRGNEEQIAPLAFPSHARPDHTKPAQTTPNQPKPNSIQTNRIESNLYLLVQAVDFIRISAAIDDHAAEIRVEVDIRLHGQN